MKMFSVNGKVYQSKEFTFGVIRQFEDYGLQMSEIQNKPMTMVSAYLSVCGKMPLDKADEEINEHVINGGNFDDVMEVISEEMNNSRFFQALNKKSEETPKQVEEKKK